MTLKTIARRRTYPLAGWLFAAILASFLWVPAARPQALLPGAVNTPTNFPNYAPAGGNFLYAGTVNGCTQTLLPGDNGALSGTGCVHTFFNDWSPGWYYGSPGSQGTYSWFVSSALDVTVSSTSDAIHNGLNMFANYSGKGDVNFVSLAPHYRCFVGYGSDQGCSVFQLQPQELREWDGVVASGSPGATTLAITCRGSCSSLGTGGALIDLSQGIVSGTVTGLAASPVPFVALATTSFPLPLSAVGTLQANLSVNRNAPNTTLREPETLATFHVAAASHIAPGTLIDFVGPPFNEVTSVTSSSTVAMGIQSVTALVRYSHTAGATVCIGGAVGRYIEATRSTADGQIYLFNLLCSPTANTMWMAYQGQGGFNSNAVKLVLPGPVNVYHGAEVVGVVDPSTNTPDGGYVHLAANDAAWRGGDVIKDTNSLSSIYTDVYDFSTVNNPFAERVMNYQGWAGYGGGLGASIANRFVNQISPMGYSSGTVRRQFEAPGYISVHGAIANGLAFDYAPQHSANPYMTGVDGQQNARGSILAVSHCNPEDPTETIFIEGDNGDAIYYNCAASQFSFHSAAGLKAAGFASSSGTFAVDGGGHMNLTQINFNAGGASLTGAGFGHIGVTGTLDITGGGVRGDAVAPTGSCTVPGTWAFTQDGHASFCNAGKWVLKI